MLLKLIQAYVEDEDCRHFHSSLSQLCSEHGEAGTYRAMKQTCDEYFFIPCRGEHRGIGGVFFDDLTAAWAPSFCVALMRAALDEDGPYMPIARRRLAIERAQGHTEAQKEWQLLRRGRCARGICLEANKRRSKPARSRTCHVALPATRPRTLPASHRHPRLAAADVEFNLLYDRGVKFGLSPESVERVLVSSPPMVAFKYRKSSEPLADSPEAATLRVLREPREWAD